MGERREGLSGNPYKGPMAKDNRGRIEGRGWWVGVGQGKVMVGKWRQLYLNNNKKIKIKN